MRYNTVVIGAGASPERLGLMDYAHRAGLRVVISCGAVHSWIQDGRLENRPAEVTEVVDPEVALFGQKFMREGETLSLPIELAPGDAALFEIVRKSP